MTGATRFALVLAASACLTAIWSAPLVTHLDSRVLGAPSDATSTIRDYWAISAQHGTPFTLRRDRWVGAPEGVALSPGSQIANGLQPLVVLGLHRVMGLVAAWNIFVLGGVALTGAMMFTLLSALGLRPIAAAFGAYAFTSSGYLVDKAYAGHAGLVQAWLFPLLLVALLKAHRERSLISTLGAGLVCGLAFYVHTYYGVIALFMLVLFHMYTAVRERESRGVPGAAKQLGQALVVVGALVAPALFAMRHFGTSLAGGGTHPLDALQQFGARIPAYFTPSTWSPLGHLVPSGLESHLLYSGEPSLLFGWTTIGLATAWLIWIRRNRGSSDNERFLTWFAAVLAVAAFGFSLPRLFAIGPLNVPAPSWFVGHLSTTIRVYARFGVLVGLGLVILAAFTVDRLERTRGRRWGAACLVLLALELTPALPAATWDTNAVPVSDTWLAEHPGGIVAIYPLAGDEPAAARLNGREYYFQRFHGHPLFSAITTSMPKPALALRVVSQYFTTPWTPSLLAAEHVKYVVLRTDVYRELGQTTPTLDAKQFQLVARLADSRIYLVKAVPANLPAFFHEHGADLASALGQRPPEDEFTAGFYQPETFQFYKTPFRWMRQDARITIKPDSITTTVEFTTLAFSAGKPRTLELFGPDHRLLGSAVVTTSMVNITFGPFSVAPGSATYTLHVTPGPQELGATDPRVASVYLNQPVFKPVLELGKG